MREARDKMLLFLPVVGLETGAIWALLAWLCRYLALPALVQGAVLGAYPFVVTGFIHLDGFMDVTDAVRSCRDLARRREILKDSRVGSFAVIGVVLLALCQTALFASGKDGGEPLDACASSGSQPVRFGARRNGAAPDVYEPVRRAEKAEVTHHRSLCSARGLSRGRLSCRVAHGGGALRLSCRVRARAPESVPARSTA